MAASILRYKLKGKARTVGHVRTFLGWFWVCVHNVAHACEASERKLGQKPKSIPIGDKALNVSSFNFSRKNKQFIKRRISKSD